MFNEEKTKRVKKFIERFEVEGKYYQGLMHSKGEYAGTHFILQYWQYDEIIKSLYGTLNPEGFFNQFH